MEDPSFYVRQCAGYFTYQPALTQTDSHEGRFSYLRDFATQELRQPGVRVQTFGFHSGSFHCILVCSFIQQTCLSADGASARQAAPFLQELGAQSRSGGTVVGAVAVICRTRGTRCVPWLCVGPALPPRWSASVPIPKQPSHPTVCAPSLLSCLRAGTPP